MPGPLPVCLRKGVQEARGLAEYVEFMKIVCSFQLGSISHEEANKKVKYIIESMASDSGQSDSTDEWRKSHRPDLYNMFVQWSAPAPLGTICFDFMPTDVPVKDPQQPRRRALQHSPHPRNTRGNDVKNNHIWFSCIS